MLAQFPFEILGFHADNGLAETKNGAVVRKEFGYEHIHRRHAARLDTYCREYLNRFLNFHRPCLLATELAGPKKPGRIKRVYRPCDAMTPLDKLASLPDAASCLRPGLTLLAVVPAGTRSDRCASRRGTQRGPHGVVQTHEHTHRLRRPDPPRSALVPHAHSPLHG